MVTKDKGLTRGRKRKLPPGLADNLRSHLETWRDRDLFGMIHGVAAPFLVSVSGDTYLGDDVIEQVCNSGVYLRTEDDFMRNAHWGYGIDGKTGQLNEYGIALLKELGKVYDRFDIEQKRAAAAQPRRSISPSQFYSTAPSLAGPSRRTPALLAPSPGIQTTVPTQPPGARRSARQAAKSSQR